MTRSRGVSVDQLERLYRSRFATFVRVASAIAGDEARGAYAVQDAFVKAIRLRAGFRGEASLESWVWRIVLNSARTARGRDERRTLVETSVERNGSAPAERDTEVLGWLAALPPRQREVVFLRYFADLDYRSIAAALEIEVGTVSATLGAARRTLRSQLEVAP